MGAFQDLQAAVLAWERLLQQRKAVVAGIDAQLAAAESRMLSLARAAAAQAEAEKVPIAQSSHVKSPTLQYLLETLKANPELDYHQAALDLYGEDSSWCRQAIARHIWHLHKRRGLIERLDRKTWKVKE